MKRPRYLLLSLILLISTTAVSGCSVGMALSGQEDPDLSAIRVGASRGEVEMQLGEPIKSTRMRGGGSIDVYEYEIGNEPDAGRAVLHGIADVLTLGLWEIVGTPIEGVTGEIFQATIIYNRREQVAKIEAKKIEN